IFFFFSSRRRHTRWPRDWSSDVCSSDLSEPYLRTGLCLLVAKASDIQSISDVNRPGRRIVVKQGTTGQTYAAAHLKTPEVRVLRSEERRVGKGCRSGWGAKPWREDRRIR